MPSSRREFLRAAGASALALAAARRGVAAPNSITLAAVGDCMISRRISMLDSPGFLEIIKLLRSADVAFGNFEMTLADADASPAYHQGCAYVHLRADLPDNKTIAEDLRWAGIRMVGLANNHALDYGAAGALSTIAKLDDAGLVHAGTGRDLSEARAPGYFDAAQGRVALLACATTFPDWTQAADGNGEVPGRAGLNPLRLHTTYQVTAQQLASLQAIARDLGLPAPTANQLNFLNGRFTAATAPAIQVAADSSDTAAITAAIHRASRNADLTLLGIHAHEGDRRPDAPSPFLRPFAHACLDAGADAFLGHGPHVLRGIELYQGKPIFYSLGNFIFHGESEKQIPPETYRECGVEGTDPSDVFDKVLPGFSSPPFWESVVPLATFENKKLTQLKLYPVTLRPDLSRPRRGSPELVHGDAAAQIIRHISQLSEPFGTRIEFDGQAGVVRLPG